VFVAGAGAQDEVRCLVRDGGSGVPGGAAVPAGLRDGDVLLRIGGAPLGSFAELRQWLAARRAGDPAEIVDLRDGVPATVAATLGARPRAAAAIAGGAVTAGCGCPGPWLQSE
jgi:hypothetical protein